MKVCIAVLLTIEMYNLHKTWLFNMNILQATIYIYMCVYIICIISFLKELNARVHAKNFKAVAQQEQSLVYRLLRPFNTETVGY